MDGDFIWYVGAGFMAQLIDGAMSMAYGVTASSLLLGLGLPPATVSSTVHAAECFTTGASAMSHRAFGNIDRSLFFKLLIPGIIGAVTGAYILTTIPGDNIKPWIAAYLFIMGIIIVIKALRNNAAKPVTKYLRPLGFFGAFIDAIGGGGWGPIVATNLLARGNDIRKTVGTVIAVEFFVTLAASLTFLMTIGLKHIDIIIGLGLGGLLAAPLGAWVVKTLPAKPFMIFVGVFVIALSLYNFVTIAF